MITAYRSRFGSHWPLFEFWHDKMKKPMRVVHDFIDPIVAAAINRKKEEMRSPSLDRDDETLLENLVNSTEGPFISIYSLSRSHPQSFCRSNYIEGRNHVIVGCWTGYGEFQMVFIPGSFHPNSRCKRLQAL